MHSESESAMHNLTEQRKRAFYLGLTNTLDRILKLDDTVLSNLAREYQIGKDELYPNVPDEIHSVRELLRLFLGMIYRGSGGESAFRADDICTFLNERFDFTEALGGTGVRASAILEEAGLTPTVHLTATSGRAACLAAERPFKAVSSPEDQFQYSRPDTGAGCGADCPHYIFQYHGGFRVQLMDGEIVARGHNRLIFTNDPVNDAFPINPDFLRQYAENDGPATLLISGFNGIKDYQRLQRRLSVVRQALVGPRMPNKASILELGAYKNLEFLTEVLRELGPMVDYVSMNEEELVQLGAAESDGSGQQTSDQLIEKAASVAKRLRLENLIVHSASMSFCFTRGTHHPHHLRDCLMGANAIAATKTTSDDFSSLRDRMNAGFRLPANPVGATSSKRIDGKRFNDHVVVAEPARIVEGELGTIGLGDSFIGAFALFLR